MRVLVAAAALLCCDAAAIQHSLYVDDTGPSVLNIPKPGINLVEVHNTVKIPEEVSESVPLSRIPSPVLITHLDAPLIDEEEVLLDEQSPTPWKSPVPVPVRIFLRAEVVENSENSPASAPGKELASDAPLNHQQSAPSIVSLPVVVVPAPEPLEAPEPPLPSIAAPFVGGQFHSQDELKQYSFGHWGGPSTRVESKDAFGRTHGSFAYVNPVGDVHVRKYSAAPSVGFRVAASDLPVDTPEVATLKAAHEQAHLTFLSFREEVQ